MEQQAAGAGARAVAFANGLRKSTAASGRRWLAWPGGAAQLAAVIACIDCIAERLRAGASAGDDDPTIPAAVADLRAVLEWTTYQSAALAVARALIVARRTRAFVERFGLLDGRSSGLDVLSDADTPLIESVRTRNGYMLDLAQRYPHIGFPPPLVTPRALVRPASPKPGRLALIQALLQSSRTNGRS
jgi:hypothetical protein